MKSKNQVNVIEVRTTPKLSNPLIQKGIRDKTQARAWGEKNGFSIVYFIARQQKVYGEKLRADVAQMAQGIEKKSEELVMFAEGAAI